MGATWGGGIVAQGSEEEIGRRVSEYVKWGMHGRGGESIHFALTS